MKVLARLLLSASDSFVHLSLVVSPLDHELMSSTGSYQNISGHASALINTWTATIKS